MQENVKRKICVFTGNRAEFGLLAPVIRSIHDHPELLVRVIVSGAHLDEKWGKTHKEIEAEGVEVSYEVAIDYPVSRGAVATPLAISGVVKEIAGIIELEQPDIFLVYADRFETFGAAIAASQAGVVTAHIEGGDLTDGGALDDSVRHAITKLSHYHFTTNAEAAARILGMGEESWRVKCVGLTTSESIRSKNFASPAECEAQLGITISSPIIIFTQHSVATEHLDAERQVADSLLALTKFRPIAQIIITYPNNDLGGEQIISKLRALNSDCPEIIVVKSLGRYLYHGLLALAVDPNVRICIVGNSSSGIKETPFFHCPTVNIGSRQNGRLRAGNVIDVGQDAASIADAIKTCLFDDRFRSKCRQCENPYDAGESPSLLISKALAEAKLGTRALNKQMTY